MPIDPTKLPDQPESDEPVLTLPDTNASLLRQQYRADPTTAAKEAQVYDITKRTALPAQVVRGDIAKAERLANEPDWGSVNTKLAKTLLSNPDLFRAAKDNVEELTLIEKNLMVLAEATKATLGLAEGAVRLPKLADQSAKALALRNLERLDEKGTIGLGDFFTLIPSILVSETATEDLPGAEGGEMVADKIAEARRYLNAPERSAPLTEYSKLAKTADEAFLTALESGDTEALREIMTNPVFLAGSVAQALPSLVAAVASGGSLLAIAIMEGGGIAIDIAEFERETGEKVTPEHYAQATAQAMVINSILERIVPGEILKKSGPGIIRRLLKIAGMTVLEAGTEGTQELSSNVAKYSTYNPEQNLVEGIVPAVAGGGGAGTTVSTMTQIGGALEASGKARVVKRQRQIVEAGAKKIAIDNVLNQLRDARLRELSPDVFEEVVEGMTAGTDIEDVFFDAEELIEYYAQQDIEIDDALADLPEVLEQVKEVVATGGGDVLIPLHKVGKHLLDRPEDAGISEHMRVDPDMMSKAEADQARESQLEEIFTEEAERIIAGKLEDDLFVQEVKEVEAAVLDQLERANRFTSDVNKTYAAFATNFYTVMAARENMSPLELAKRQPFDVDAVTAKGPNFSLFNGPAPVQADVRVTPPVRPDGRVELVHFTKEAGITEIDPAKQKGLKDGKRRMDKSQIPRSYYGIAPGTEHGYRVENWFQGSDVNRLTASIPVDRLYDAQADPDNIWDKWSPEDNVRNAGYAGYWSNDSQLGLVATIFEPLPVEEPQESFFQKDLAPLVRAQKNNLGLFSAVEQAVLNMNIPQWSKKAAKKLFTPQDAERLAELEDEYRSQKPNHNLSESEVDRLEVVNDDITENRAVITAIGMEEAPRKNVGFTDAVLNKLEKGMTVDEANAEVEKSLAERAELLDKELNLKVALADYQNNPPKELAKLRERMLAKQVGGLASGKEIWQKLNTMPNVKKDELFTLGLEEYLKTAGKLSRGDVVNYVQNNGVKIVEVIATEDNFDEDAIDEDSIDWDEEVDDDPSNWGGRVEDYIYYFDRADLLSDYGKEDDQRDDYGYVMDTDTWIDDNMDTILDEMGMEDHRIEGQFDWVNEGYDSFEQDEDNTAFLELIKENEDELGVNVEDVIREAMRSAYEEKAEEKAEEEYLNDPYLIVTSPQLDNITLVGNDDVGWSINGEFNDIYSQNEAQIQAIQMAREDGQIVGGDENNTEVARWGPNNRHGFDAIQDTDTAENYVERKFTLPENPGRVYNNDTHFPDDNILLFTRETDRDIVVDHTPKEVVVKIHHQETAGQVMLGNDLRYFRPGFYITQYLKDGTFFWANQNPITHLAADQSELMPVTTMEEAEAALATFDKPDDVTQTSKVRLVDELQSDPHQAGQEFGYIDPNEDGNGFALERQAETVAQEVDDETNKVFVELKQREMEAASHVGRDLEHPGTEVVAADADAVDADAVFADITFDNASEPTIYRFSRDRFKFIARGLLNDHIEPERGQDYAGIRMANAGNVEAVHAWVWKQLKESDLDLDALSVKMDEVHALMQEAKRFQKGVSDMPFKDKGWIELGMKRALIDAVENGFEYFAWADSNMVVQRWGHGPNNDYQKAYVATYDEKATGIIRKLTKLTPVRRDWNTGERIVLPKVEVLSVGEQFGWKVTWNEGGIQFDEKGDVVSEEEEVIQLSQHDSGANKGFFKDEADAKRAAIRYANDQIKANYGGEDEFGYWSIPITDELRELVQAEGFALYQDKTRGAFTPSTNTITLLAEANLSTFLHEFGHWQLEVMADLASTHGGSQSIKQDMQIILDWFGVENVSVWNSMSLEQKRVHHEKFARGFEKYLFTGRAPNSNLSDIFARIREWMITTYESIKELNVTLTPEVTEVFDRLVASKEQIAEAEELQGYRQVFKSEAESEMTPAQWRDYQAEARKPTEDAERDLQDRALRDMAWLRNARSRELKRLQAKAKGKRAQIRDEVAAEVMAEPIQQAITFLKTGEVTTPEGEEIKVEQGHRLATASLEEMYPATALGNRDWRALPTGRYGLRGKEGLHPDVVAGIFGFSSGDDLVADLLAAENAKAKIDGITDQRMLERYGEISSPEALELAVDNAIHNEARTKFIATELVALEKATGQKSSLLRAAKQYAKEVVGNMEIRNLKKTNRYSVSERKAASEKEKALRNGDRDLAAKHARSQLVSNLLYRESLKANDEVPKMLRLFKKFGKPGIRKNLDQQYLDQIDQLLERYDLRSGQSQHKIDRRISLNAWYESQVSGAEGTAGFEPAIDPRLLNEAARTHYTRLTLNEMRGLYDSIRSIEHIGRWKKKLLTAKDKREFKARMDEAIQSIEDNATKVVKERMENNGMMDKAADGWHEWFAMHRKLSSIVRTMDGLKDGGVIYDLLLRPANERADQEAVEHEKATLALDEILKPIYSQHRMTKKIDIPGTDKRISIEGRFVMLLNMGNAVNYDRLSSGELSHGWTDAEFEAVKNSASKEEWDAVQEVWDFINGYWADIAAKQVRLTGVAPEKVEAEPVDTPYGTYRGGYFPISYNPKRSRKSDANTQNELLAQKLKGNYSAATTRRGHIKARGESGTGPLRYDLGVITDHVSNVIHDLTWHEWAIDANRIARDSDFEQAVRTHYGDPVVKLITHAIEDIIVGDVPAKNAWERGVNRLRIGSTIVGLGYSVFTSALQPLGLAQSMVRIGPQHVAKGMARWLGSAKSMEDSVAWIYENSDFMRLRNKTMMREMDEVLNQVRGEKLTKVKASFFYFIAKAQMIADVPTWIGQYHKSIDGGADHDTAVQLANQAVKDSQGSGLLMDRAEIQRGGPLLKIFTNFYSYFNATYQLLSDSKSQTNFRKPKDVGLFAVDFLMLTMVPATMAAILREAIYSLAGGGDGEERDPLEVAQWLARENLSYMAGLMVGVREMSSALQGYYGYSGPAGLRFFNEFGKFLQQSGQLELDKQWLKSANQVGGLVFHYPAAQVERTAEGIVELAEGETVNPLILLTGTE